MIGMLSNFLLSGAPKPRGRAPVAVPGVGAALTLSGTPGSQRERRGLSSFLDSFRAMDPETGSMGRGRAALAAGLGSLGGNRNAASDVLSTIAHQRKAFAQTQAENAKLERRRSAGERLKAMSRREDGAYDPEALLDALVDAGEAELDTGAFRDQYQFDRTFAQPKVAYQDGVRYNEKDPSTAPDYIPTRENGMRMVADPNSPSGYRAVPIAGYNEALYGREGAAEAAKGSNFLTVTRPDGGQDVFKAPRGVRPDGSPGESGPVMSAPLAPVGGGGGAGSVDDVWRAAILQESGGRPGVQGPATRYGRAEGLTQMLPATARSMAEKLGLPWRPELMRGTSDDAARYQERLGRGYFDEALQRYGGDTRKALAYYHGGPNERLWGPKTNAHVEAVMRRVRPTQDMLAGGSGRDDLGGSAGADDLERVYSAPRAAPARVERGPDGSTFVRDRRGDLSTVQDPRRGTVYLSAEEKRRNGLDAGTAYVRDVNGIPQPVARPAPKPSGMARLTEKEQAEIAEARARVRAFDRVEPLVSEFQQLNRRQKTGGLPRGLNLPFNMGGVSDLESKWDPEIGRMSAITAELAPNKRQAGSGTSSDKDVALFLRSLPNVDALGSVNARSIAAIRREGSMARSHAAFLESFAAQNGTLNGAEAAWQRSQRQSKSQDLKNRSASSRRRSSSLTVDLTGRVVR